MKDSYAVITGASQGLGRAFAEELAKQNNNLILVSLPGQNLKEFAEELQTEYLVKTSCYEIDLSIKENVLDLSEWINSKFSIHMLINNAGIGGSKKFSDASGSYIEKIIQLNVLATSLLTHQLLPNLQKSSNAYVLNVSSLAAFSPIGYKTVYPASKAFIHSFSRGLYQELKDTNVFVSVVNPGPMKTNAEVSRRIEEQGFWARITCLDPQRVARYCIRRLKKRDTVIMVNHISWLLLKILPIWLKMPMLTNKIKREINIATL
ncbi:SDR family NAD(P)-dependent oxidoreductase [Elizabethkingia anophelis]|uniref:SDR family NAD(P)-dependent oxidoreductase n=1 Tax=Elizabethkingia anophelis TaxID=1117645 RepID=UPI00063AEB7A|nr:SDR family NAD(P)-dependent oxidoreductase [Elizabethkingia anophelis]AKH94147.1 short-chain dehydrogenase [Elizabethkingia anophelis FMS-007]